MSPCPHVTAKEGILFNEVRTEFCGQSQAVFNRGLLLCEKKAFSFWDVLFTNKSKNNRVDLYIYIYIYLPYKRKKKKGGTVATLTARLTAAVPQRCGRACTRHLQKAVCLNAWNAHLPFGFTYLLLHKWRTVPWY